MSSFEFAYDLITFYKKRKLSFAVNLSIHALISGLHKMTSTLDLGNQGGVHIHRGESLYSKE